MDTLSFVLALAPILWLVVMLLVFKWPAWRAAIGSLVISCALAFGWWHLPADNVATAVLEGFLMALWPIVIVIIAAVFTYNLCVSTGAMDVIGKMISSISSDRRVLALLVAWCFGGFMEGMAGFGTAVAIPAGMLAGMGYAPIPAVLMCLLANGVPTPYGSIGIPTVSLASVVGMDAANLAFSSDFCRACSDARVIFLLFTAFEIDGSGRASIRLCKKLCLRCYARGSVSGNGRRIGCVIALRRENRTRYAVYSDRACYSYNA